VPSADKVRCLAASVLQVVDCQQQPCDIHDNSISKLDCILYTTTAAAAAAATTTTTTTTTTTNVMD